MGILILLSVEFIIWFTHTFIEIFYRIKLRFFMNWEIYFKNLKNMNEFLLFFKSNKENFWKII